MSMTPWKAGKVVLLSCVLLFSNQVWADGPETIRLGVPDVVFGRRSTEGTLQQTIREALESARVVTELEPPAQFTPEQWRQLEVAGFSRKPAIVFRAYQNPSPEDKANLAGADAWVTFEPMGGDEYLVNGQVNLTRLANNGLLTNALVKALLSSDLPDEAKREVYALRRQSQRAALEIQSGLLSLLDPDDQVEVTVTISLDLLTGVSVDAQTTSAAGPGILDGLWSGIKDTVSCLLGAVGTFISGQSNVNYSITCGTSGCNVTMSGSASGAAVAVLMASWKESM